LARFEFHVGDAAPEIVKTSTAGTEAGIGRELDEVPRPRGFLTALRDDLDLDDPATTGATMHKEVTGAVGHRTTRSEWRIDVHSPCSKVPDHASQRRDPGKIGGFGSGKWLIVPHALKEAVKVIPCGKRVRRNQVKVLEFANR
jgi:hypothetical protein